MEWRPILYVLYAIRIGGKAGTRVGIRGTATALESE